MSFTNIQVRGSLCYLFLDALFVDPPEERGEREQRSRERELRREVVGLLYPWLQRHLFTQDLYNEGANTLVSLFQHPVLNKQVEDNSVRFMCSSEFLVFL